MGWNIGGFLFAYVRVFPENRIDFLETHFHCTFNHFHFSIINWSVFTGTIIRAKRSSPNRDWSSQLEVEVYEWTLDLASLESSSAQLLSDKYAVQKYEEVPGPFR